MKVLWWYRLLDFLRVQWQKYKATFIWLLVWLIAGLVFGIVTIYLGKVGVDDINYHLIDGNLLNATATNSSIGNFIWQRVLSLILPITLVLILASIARFTALIVYPVVLIHGYWLAVAVWWTFFYYNVTAILLLVFYIICLLLVTAILLAGLLWALQCGANFRNSGGSQNCPQIQNWGNVLRGALIIIGIAICLGIFEYLVFWTVLGKIVYKPRSVFTI